MKFAIYLILIFNFLNAQIVLVTNKNSKISELKKEEVVYLYLGKINKIHNTNIKPVLSKDEKLHNEFVNNILNKTSGQFNSYWARMIFTGKKSSLESIDTMNIEEELENLNTIIYIYEEDLKNKWKIIYKN